MVGSLSGGFMQLPMTREKKKQENLLARTGLDPFSRSSRSEGGLWPRATTLKTRTQISRTGLRLENNFTISRELHVEEKIYICIYVYTYTREREKNRKGRRRRRKKKKKKNGEIRQEFRLNGPPCPDGTCILVAVYKEGGGEKRGEMKEENRERERGKMKEGN